MKVPAELHIGGGGGDPRFGVSMQGESIIRRDPVNLPDFLNQFSTGTLAWYYLNRLDRLSDTDGVVTFSGGVTSRSVDGKLQIRRGDIVLRDGNDMFVPALWQKRHREIIAYSRDGYTARTWQLPKDWSRVRSVDVYQVGQEGLTPVARDQKVMDGGLELSVPAGTAFSIVPHATHIGGRS